jgi:hypothetical protein
MRKHKKGSEESNQEAKRTGSGAPSGQERRTVRTGHADRPPMYRGLSAQVRRTVRPGPRTVRQSQQNHQKRTPKNGPSAGSTRTVRQAPADRPPAAADRPKLRPKKKLKIATDRNERRARTRRTPGEHVRRGPSAWTPRTIREARTEQKNSPTSKVNSPKSSSDFPND